MTQMTSLLLVDDHALVRDVLADRFRQEEGFHVVGMAATADDAVRLAIDARPDIVVMDIDMPGLSCFDAVKTISTRCPATAVIFLSAHFHDRYVEQALSANAAGYVTKGQSVETIVSAVRAVAGGESYFSPDIQARLVVDENGARLAREKDTPMDALTTRELEVLGYIARGHSQKEIGEIMHLSHKTVHRHTANLMGKLDIHDRVELARFAIREGLAEA